MDQFPALWAKLRVDLLREYQMLTSMLAHPLRLVLEATLQIITFSALQQGLVKLAIAWSLHQLYQLVVRQRGNLQVIIEA